MSQFVKLARDDATNNLSSLLAADVANMSDTNWVNKVGDAVGDTFNKLLMGDYEGEKVFGREITDGKVQTMLSCVEDSYKDGRLILDPRELNIIDQQNINYLK